LGSADFSLSVTAVPLPAAVWLFAAGIAVLGAGLRCGGVRQLGLRAI
jgi:hypothetical protein